MSAGESGRLPWSVVHVPHIEAWRDAIFGAGLDAVQISSAPLEGSLAFASADGITFSSGRVGGHLALTGALSETEVTFGVGLRAPPGTRMWLDEVSDSTVAVFQPGDVHEALWRPGSLYAAAAMDAAKLEEMAAGFGLVLTAAELNGTGLSDRPLDKHKSWLLEGAFSALHAGRGVHPRDADLLGEYLVDVLIEHLAREPRILTGPWKNRGAGRVVARACKFIEENLSRPLTARMIARAVQVSASTLHRAFSAILDETPRSYVLKLRLNRLRQCLANEAEAACTLAVLARRWGLKESPRLAGQYRDLFGEFPWQTRAADGSSNGIERVRRAIGAD